MTTFNIIIINLAITIITIVIIVITIIIASININNMSFTILLLVMMRFRKLIPLCIWDLWLKCKLRQTSQKRDVRNFGLILSEPEIGGFSSS